MGLAGAALAAVARSRRRTLAGAGHAHPNGRNRAI